MNNPRHLSIGPGANLYVAEAGSGGNGPCVTSSEGGQVCYGATGGITELTNGRMGWIQRQVVSGLPSLAESDGGSATGPSDVQVIGNQYFASIGLGAPPDSRNSGSATASATDTSPATLPAGFGDVISGHLATSAWCVTLPFLPACQTGGWSTFADITQFEADHNPVDDPDSNPVSLARRGSDFVVADAGGNTVLNVSSSGAVSLIAAFGDSLVEFPPNSGQTMGMQFVPTRAIPTANNTYYVSQLSGFPFPPDGAVIKTVTLNPRGGDIAGTSTYATGLTNVTDMAFASNGDLYAVEISTAGLASGGPPIGAVVRISADPSHTVTTVADGLFAPYGITLFGGNAYVTVGSVLPGGGQVIEIPLGWRGR